METAEKCQGTPAGHVEANHMRLSAGFTYFLRKQIGGWQSKRMVEPFFMISIGIGNHLDFGFHQRIGQDLIKLESFSTITADHLVVDAAKKRANACDQKGVGTDNQRKWGTDQMTYIFNMVDPFIDVIILSYITAFFF